MRLPAPEPVMHIENVSSSSRREIETSYDVALPFVSLIYFVPTSSSKSSAVSTIIKTLDEIKQENEVVMARLHRQDELFRAQAQTNHKN